MSYFNFIWRSHRSFLLFSMIFTALFQFLILKLVATIDYSPFINIFMEQMPENVRAMFSEDLFSTHTVEGAAAFGLNHPLVLVILTIGAIAIPSRHVAGEAETGTLELLLSFPITRVAFMLNLFITSAVFILLIVVCAVGGSLLSIHMFHELTVELWINMLKIGCNLWLLMVFIMGLTMMLSSFEKEGSKVSIRAAGVTLVFYLLHYLSALWDAIRFTKPFNIFTYYQPEDLMTEQRSFLFHAVVLSVSILVCLGISLIQFHRRDIPG